MVRMRSGQATRITGQAVWLGAFAAAVVAAAVASAGLRFGAVDAWSVWLTSGLVVGAFAVAPRPARPWVLAVFVASMLGTARVAGDSVSVAAGVAIGGVSQAICFELFTSRAWRRDLHALGGRLAGRLQPGQPLPHAAGPEHRDERLGEWRSR